VLRDGLDRSQAERFDSLTVWASARPILIFTESSRFILDRYTAAPHDTH
jgi:hypothetical protein